ncbi:MAG: cyclic nucleotide-binding domain-containing protein [Gammaproteobacteria bacterium]|nr:cyclic nucleotide-binding domain-containing protein [Gammaproteobacteria bacterium]
MGAVKQFIDEKVLRTFIPLNALGLDKIHELASKSNVEKIAATRTLFRQGDQDKRIIYLLAGEVELSAEGRAPHVIRAGSPQANHPLAPHQPRPATARAKTSATILVIDPDLLDILLNWNQPGGYEVTEIPSDSDTDWLTRFLQAHTTLKLPADNIQALLQRLEELPVKAGTVVIRQNDNDQHYYIIKQGRCSVSRRASADAEDIKLAELTAGDGFGEEALITHGRRNATITMIEDGVLMRLTRRDFITYLSDPLLHRVPYGGAMSMLQEGAVLLDVRTPDEFARNGVGINIPLPLLRIKAAGLDKQRTYVLCCDNGSRSSAAAFLLIQQGLNACILDGGLDKLPAHSLKDKPQEASTPAVGSGADVVNLNVVKAQHNKTRPAAAKKTDDGAVSAAQARRVETAEVARTAAERETARLQAEFEATRAAAEQETARLRAEMEAMRVAADAVRVDTERMAARLMADIATARQGETEARKQTEAQARRAEQELVLLKAELSTARATTTQTTTQIATAEASRLEAERELTRLKEEAQVARRNRVDADKRAEEYLHRAQEAEAARAAAEQETARLRAEIEAARAAAVQVTNQSVSLEAARLEEERERAHLKAQIDDLRQQCAQTDHHGHEQARRAETAETARMTAEQAATRLKTELESARAEVIQVADKIAATETAHARAQREIMQLKAEVESLHSQLRPQALAPAAAPPSAVESVQETPRAKTAPEATPDGTAAAATPTTSLPDDDLQSLGAIKAIYAAFRVDMQTESARSKTSRSRAAAAQNTAATKTQPQRGTPAKPARPAEETAAETAPAPQAQTPKPVQLEPAAPAAAVALSPASTPQTAVEPRAGSTDRPQVSEQEPGRLLKKSPLPPKEGEGGKPSADFTYPHPDPLPEGEGVTRIFQQTANVGELAPAVLTSPDDREHPAVELPAAQLPTLVSPPPHTLPGQPVTDEFVIETSDIQEDAEPAIRAQQNLPVEPPVDAQTHPFTPAAAIHERAAVLSGLSAHGRLRLIAIAVSAALIIGIGTVFYRLGAAAARQTGVHAASHPVSAMIIPKAGSVTRPR